MPTRRLLVSSTMVSAAVAALPFKGAFADDAGSFSNFLRSFQADARRSGISQATLDRAFAGIQLNQKVLDRDKHQPESTLTWAKYRDLVIGPKRITDGKAAVAANWSLFQQVQQRFGVPPGPVAGIWGLESNFGSLTGSFRVVEALATLAWDGRRASFFRGELMAALKILDHGDITPEAMTGSYAGAMGQPQFMPSSYLRYAVDLEGTGRRDIWHSKLDVLGSIANYLAESGWRPGLGWGQSVMVPPGVDASGGRDAKRPLRIWSQAGVRPLSGRWAGMADTPAGLVAPDGPAGDVFVVFDNFNAIRRYNPSDYYALAVGLIGDQVSS
jgi:membrane-bound lytic murein transglycosylase B